MQRSGLSYDKVITLWNRSPIIPDRVKDELSKTKLVGFIQNPNRSHVSCVQRAYLASIFGVALETVDPDAANECRLILAGLSDLALASTTWNTAQLELELAA